MMNSFFVTAAVAASTAFLAQGADLVAEWDGFSELSNGGLTLSLNGSTRVIDEATGAVCLKVDGRSGNQNARPTISLAGQELSLARGVTFSLHLKGKSVPYSTANYLAGASAEDEFLFAMGAFYNGQADVLFKGSTNGLVEKTSTGTTVPPDGEAVVTLTAVQDGNHCEFVLYSNGEKVASGRSWDMEETTQNLERLSFGGWSGNSDNGRISYDLSRLAVYEGAMTPEDVAAQHREWSVPKQKGAVTVADVVDAALNLLALAVAFLLGWVLCRQRSK